jgi:hypothetical protein
MLPEGSHSAATAVGRRGRSRCPDDCAEEVRAFPPRPRPSRGEAPAANGPRAAHSWERVRTYAGCFREALGLADSLGPGCCLDEHLARSVNRPFCPFVYIFRTLMLGRMMTKNKETTLPSCPAPGLVEMSDWPRNALSSSRLWDEGAVDEARRAWPSPAEINAKRSKVNTSGWLPCEVLGSCGSPQWLVQSSTEVYAVSSL